MTNEKESSITYTLEEGDDLMLCTHPVGASLGMRDGEGYVWIRFLPVHKKALELLINSLEGDER